MKVISVAQAKRIVLKEYPTAFAFYEGRGVWTLHTKDRMTDPCPHCSQHWDRVENSLFPVVGSNSFSEDGAWLEAAKSILNRREFKAGSSIRWELTYRPLSRRTGLINRRAKRFGPHLRPIAA